jgi:hypothetical protein
MTDFKMDDYVPVNERIDAFYAKHPEGSLQSDIFELSPDRVVIKAWAYRTPDDPRPGVGHSSLNIPGSTPFTKFSEIENAETSAWGRAIAALGFEVKRGVSSREEVRNKQPQGGERVDKRGGVSRQPAMTRPGVQRTAEESALLDELLAMPGITYAQMHLLADAVGVPTGQHANADQLREMIARMTTPSAGVPTPDGQGEADSSVSASPASDTPPPVGDSPAAATAPAGALSPPPQPVLAPTLDDVLAVTGGELLPPQPGTPEYKALVATEKARARAHWQKREVKP